MHQSREEGISENNSILHILTLNYVPWGVGVMIYDNFFLSPYPTDATYQIWLKLAQKFLTRRTTHYENRTLHDDGRQHRAIGHLSDSGDLTMLDNPKV